MVTPWDVEPSVIQALSMEGPALDIEPSAISAPNVDGSTPDTRTVRDSGPKRGRFNTWIPNRPRYRHQPWMVQHMDVELSMIQALSVEGSRLDTEPSTISTSSVEGSTLDTRTVHDSGPKHGRFGLGEWNHPRYRPPPWKVQHMIPEPSAIWGINVEGPALDIEPSTISAFIADGPALGCRTFRDSGPKCGRSSFGHRTVHDIDLQRGGSNT